jgi:hypothetical protein
MLAAALVLSNAPQIGTGLVCMGSDGHVDVGPSVCTCCAAPASHDERVHAEGAPASSSCRDCVDVPLRVPPLNSKAPQLSFADINAEGRTLTSTCDGRSRFDFVVPMNHMDQHWQSLFSLSTVVLLT